MDMGFPSGRELKFAIANALDPRATNELHRIATILFTKQKTEYFAALLVDERSLHSSIDEILYANADCIDIGRLSVWVTILDSEKKAREIPVASSWIYRLLDRLFAGIGQGAELYRTEVGGHVVQFLHGLAICTLNYDRLAEHVIRAWILNRGFCDIDIGSCDSQLNPGQLVRHAHGSLGNIVGEGALAFGCDAPKDPARICELASRLQFWFEPNNSPTAYSRTNRITELRGVHLITGFGYHPSITARFWLFADFSG